jgi:parvulin-like peptidyl-prolyl isomerase
MNRTPHRALCLAAAALGLLNVAAQPEPQRPDAAKNASKSSKSKTPQTLAGAHILIAFHGAKRVKQSVVRSKAEALRLAQQVAALAAQSPARFAALARQYSDGPSAPRGGDLGNWRQGMMVPAFDAAVLKLVVGQVSGPVETMFGYHVIQRRSLPPTLAGAHILVSYRGAARAKPTITRSKAAALSRAQHVAALARARPDRFAALAQQYSDGPTAPRGGDLGQWTRGRMVPAFDQAVLRLKVGQVSGAVGTIFGYHVIIRRALRP